MNRTLLIVASAVALAGPAVAGDSFGNVEYISGRAGFAKKVKGQLVIDQQAVVFNDEKGKLLFSIPMTEIDKAVAGAQNEEGSFGRKMALGIFASKTNEYLQVESHNDAGAEGVVFKVKKNTGAGMATKITYWSSKAKPSAPEPAQPPPAPNEPPPPRP